jgi:hypothetical protein
MLSEYGFAQHLVVRFMGAALVAAGVALLVLAVLVEVISLPAVVLVVGVVAAVLVLGVVGLLLTRRAAVVTLDDVGYRVRFVRGTGVARARWEDVEDVVATTVGNERCVVLRLRDGRTTVVPVRVLAATPDGFVNDLQEHLNAGHGYRRLR